MGIIRHNESSYYTKKQEKAQVLSCTKYTIFPFSFLDTNFSGLSASFFIFVILHIISLTAAPEFGILYIEHPLLQSNQDRMTGSGETGSAPKGNAKTLRQKDRVRTILCKVRLFVHRRCNPVFRGISQVFRRGTKPPMWFCAPFLF